MTQHRTRIENQARTIIARAHETVSSSRALIKTSRHTLDVGRQTLTVQRDQTVQTGCGRCGATASHTNVTEASDFLRTHPYQCERSHT